MRLALVFRISFSAALGINVFPQALSAQNGGQAGAYLRLGAGVRALGMGGAFVAMANDVTANYWNPAGLGRIMEPQLVGMYSLLALDRRYNYVAAAYPSRATGTVSFGWINYNVANAEARDATGTLTGSFANGENAFLISYGKSLSSAVALGGTVKLLSHELAGRSANGVGYDLGVWFKPQGFLAFGASVQNLQTRIYWNDRARRAETFPKIERLGVEFRPHPFVNLGVDYEMVTRERGKWRAGGEVDFSHKLVLRAGNNAGAAAFGVSLLPPVSRQTVLIEYGLSQDPLSHGLAHQFSLLLKFNQPARQATGDPVDAPASSSSAAPQPRHVEHVIAEIIEVRPPYLIVGSDNLTFLQNGGKVKVFQSRLGDETGRYYGDGEALDVSARYAIIKLPEEKSAAACAVGERLVLKFMY